MRDGWRLLRLFRPYGWWMLAGVGAGTGVVLANVGLLALSGWFVAAMALAGLGRLPIEIFAPAAAIRALAILRTGGRYGERLVTHEATLRLIASLRVWLFGRLVPLAPAALQRHRAADLMSRLRADVDALDGFYLRVAAPVLVAALGTAILLAALVWLAPAVVPVDAASLAVAGVGLPMLTLRLGRGPGRRAVALRADLRAAVTDTARGLGELLVFGGVERHHAVFVTASRALVGARRRQASIDALSASLASLAAQSVVWFTLILLLPSVAARTLPAPDLPMVALFVLAGFETVAPLSGAMQSLGEVSAAARRVFALADAAPALRDPPAPAPLPTRFDLRVTGLRMRYAAGAPWALDGLDLHVPDGGSLAITGASGSGKSSILNVLLRFWDYQEGSVTIGGVPIRNLDGNAVRGLCAVVAQRTHLFNASIRDNLRLARPEADDNALRAVLHTAGLRAEVEAMPDGLDTLAGEWGARLSGGQARRLAIARALLRDAPILLLDEPTEGLDPATEARMLSSLSALMRGRTTLLISHRPEALRLADAVLTLDGGRHLHRP